MPKENKICHFFSQDANYLSVTCSLDNSKRLRRSISRNFFRLIFLCCSRRMREFDTCIRFQYPCEKPIDDQVSSGFMGLKTRPAKTVSESCLAKHNFLLMRFMGCSFVRVLMRIFPKFPYNFEQRKKPQRRRNSLANIWRRQHFGFLESSRFYIISAAAAGAGNKGLFINEDIFFLLIGPNHTLPPVILRYRHHCMQ